MQNSSKAKVMPRTAKDLILGGGMAQQMVKEKCFFCVEYSNDNKLSNVSKNTNNKSNSSCFGQ
jgi:hypothetical protein